MDLKVVKLAEHSEPMLLGADSAPQRLAIHARQLVSTWKELVDPFQAISLFELASRVRHAASEVDHEVDASLLVELAQEARECFSNQSRVLYRLDDSMMP